MDALLQALLETCSESGQPRSHQQQIGFSMSSSSAITEESDVRGGADAAVDQASSVRPQNLPAALHPPSDARFKQLASLRLLRATYEPEAESEVDRLSVERLLQSAQRQNSAQKIRLALMQQQISNQLRIIEAQESRLAELLSHLQSLTLRSADLSAKEETVLQLIRDMNSVRAGDRREWPTFMAELISLGGRTWKKGDPVHSASQICDLLIKGDAASSHLQLSLPPFHGRPISLQQMASYGPDLIFSIMSSYKEALKAQLRAVGSADPQQAARANKRIQMLSDELHYWGCCLIFGQPSEYAARNPWFKKTPMTSIPLNIMEDALKHARFREEQLAEIQELWQQHRGAMASLEEWEQTLRARLRSFLSQASGLPDCQDLYLPMMDTVAELEANWKTQAHGAFIWDILVIGKVVEPMQLARLMAYLGPYPFRLDTMVATGLIQPRRVSST